MCGKVRPLTVLQLVGFSCVTVSGFSGNLFTGTRLVVEGRYKAVDKAVDLLQVLVVCARVQEETKDTSHMTTLSIDRY
jgi:hypothetical protein